LAQAKGDAKAKIPTIDWPAAIGDIEDLMTLMANKAKGGEAFEFIRAALGRPKGMLAAWALSLAAVLGAQALGEIAGWRTGTLGEAQVLFACLGAGLASMIVVVIESLRE